ncbi:MAG: class I SAM-dependent methyltransferase [Chloroflexi bacterium]|nr:class I SAM-dependent methyltransferase [Chloroflexota bacterium]MBU1746472.1 class I SAM-dependent methyltransferase [Chloroflexota bacterium]MBU1877796.1 class I SAM-dependent methyltransferase [Chloroflexota bacterium]
MAPDLLTQHLQALPAFRALIRATEARLFADLSLPAPILDLGCGDGHFASVGLAGPAQAGVDPWWQPLTEARARGCYATLAQAPGDRLPFSDGAFATVVSNCVLEHIPHVEPVLAEVSRVLRRPEPAEGRPGGTFVCTVVSEHFPEYLFWPTVFRRLGLPGLARRYGDWFNRHSVHHHCDDPATWQARFEAAGLRVERWQYYLSPAAARAFDLWHYLGAPTILYKRLTGRWIIAPWRWNLALTDWWLRRYYEEPAPDTGLDIFFVCRKQS